MINKTKLSINLILLISLLIILLLFILSGILTSSRLNHVKEESTEIVKENFPASQYITNLRLSIGEYSTGHSELIEAALSNNRGESEQHVEGHYSEAHKFRDDALEKWNNNLESLKKTKIYSEKDLDLDIEITNIDNLFNDLEDAFRNKNYQLAEEIMEGPGGFDESIEKTDSKLQEIEKVINNNMELLLIDIEEDIEENQTTIIISSIIGIILVILIAFFVSRKITKPISNLSITVDQISKGNFDIELDTKTGIKEINALAESLKRVLTTMKLAVLRKGPAKKRNFDIPPKGISESDLAKSGLLADSDNQAIDKPIQKSIAAIKKTDKPKKPLVTFPVKEKKEDKKKLDNKKPIDKENKDGTVS